MKKYLIVLAAAVMALASCSNGGGSKYTSIKFKNAEMTMALGATDKLQVLWEPTSLDAPVCVWASSNAEVVAVDQNGNIEALEEGEANITATYGEGEDQLKAVCKIIVKDPLDMVEWEGWSLWSLNKDTLLSPDTFDVEVSVGTVRCQIITGDFQIWDNGFIQTTDEEGEFNGITGAGYRMYLEDVPVYMIVEPAAYKGYYISYSTLYILDDPNYNSADTAYIYCAQAGKRYDAQKFYDYLLGDSTINYETECFSGVEVDYVDFEAQKAYGWQGLASECAFAGDEWQAYYRSNINWMGGICGLVIDENEEDYVKKPAEWAPFIPKYYELLPATNAKGIGEPKRFVEKHMPSVKIVRGNVDPKDVLIKK